jgi:hypothetical protein
MTQIISIVLPVFAIIFGGYWLRKKGLFEAEWVHTLNSFVYYVSLPAIILVSFWQIDWSEPGIYKLLAFNVVLLALFAVFLLFISSFLKMSAHLKAALIMTALVGNTIYMGFPILGPALNGEYFSSIIGTATIHLVLGIVFSIVIIDYLATKTGKARKYLFDFVKNPLMIALFAGIVLSLIPLPDNFLKIVQKPFSMLGATASPLALIALGAFMRGKFVRSHMKLSIYSSVLKLIIFPLFAIIVARIFGITSVAETISGLVSSMPVAATTFVIAEQHKLDGPFVANTILMTTVISLFTISFILAVLI